MHVCAFGTSHCPLQRVCYLNLRVAWASCKYSLFLLSVCITLRPIVSAFPSGLLFRSGARCFRNHVITQERTPGFGRTAPRPLDLALASFPSLGHALRREPRSVTELRVPLEVHKMLALSGPFVTRPGSHRVTPGPARAFHFTTPVWACPGCLHIDDLETA